jgi:hypothetical protein
MGETEMPMGLAFIYLELAGLFLSGSYIISALIDSGIVTNSGSSEQAILLSMQ